MANTLVQIVQKFLDEINSANRFTNTSQVYKRIEYDKESGFFILVSGYDIDDYNYTSHFSKTYQIRFKEFMGSLVSLIKTDVAHISADAIELIHKGYYDSRITLDYESKALIQRGRVQGYLKLQNKIFSDFNLIFSGHGRHVELECAGEYVKKEEIDKEVNKFIQEIK